MRFRGSFFTMAFLSIPITSPGPYSAIFRVSSCLSSGPFTATPVIFSFTGTVARAPEVELETILLAIPWRSHDKNEYVAIGSLILHDLFRLMVKHVRFQSIAGCYRF